MMKVTHVQCIIRLKAVCVQLTLGVDLLFDDLQKRFCFRIEDDGRVDLSTPC